MDMVDVLFYVHPELNETAREDLEEHLRACSGVLSVHFNTRHIHMMTVEYDPMAINSENLLRQLDKRGVEASRIGL